MADNNLINDKNNPQAQLIQFQDGQIYIKTDYSNKNEQIFDLDSLYQGKEGFKEQVDETEKSIEKNYLKVFYPNYEWIKITSQNDSPEPRTGHTATSIDQSLFLFGGCKTDNYCFNQMEVFDIQKRLWKTIETKGEAPSKRQGHSATLVGSLLYIIGGQSESGYLNDVYVYDIENEIWTQEIIVGDFFSPRGNHGAVLNNDGNIIIFGGYTEKGYSNEVYYLDLIEKQWKQKTIKALAPQPRESFSMILIRDKIWIFGGFALGGVRNDLIVLDIQEMAWDYPKTTGFIPQARQGHASILHGKNIIIIGGCDYKLNICYKDQFVLDTEELRWSKIDTEGQDQLKSRENQSLNVVGSLLFLFGGNDENNKSYNDIYVFNSNDYCPSKCSKQGICRNKFCHCFDGFQGNQCQSKLKCKHDCSNQGVCGKNGKCRCYPGFKGDICQTKQPCPKNCTNVDQGICLMNDKCKCKVGFKGDDCNLKTNEEIQCPKKCSMQGKCNSKTGTCKCNENYYGVDCSQTDKETPEQLTIKEVSKESTEKLPIEKTNDNELKPLHKVDLNTKPVIIQEDLDEIPHAQKITKNIPIEDKNDDDDLNLENPESDLDNEENKEKKEDQNQNQTQDLSKQADSEKNTQSQQQKQTLNDTTKEIQSDNNNQIKTSSDQQTQNQVIATSSDQQPQNQVKQEQQKPNEQQKESKELKNKEQQKKQEEIKKQQIQNINYQNNQDKLQKLENQTTLVESQKEQANLVNKQSSTSTADYIKHSKNRLSLNWGMFGLASQEQLRLITHSPKQKYLDLSHCKNKCSFNGFCIYQTCFCQPLSTGDDCSITNVKDLQKGQQIESLILISLIIFGIGFICGIFVLWYWNKKTEAVEFMDIQQQRLSQDYN